MSLSPLVSQLLVLGAVIYLLPYRIVVRPILLNRRAGRPTQWDKTRTLRVAFVALMCGGGGWFAVILQQATSTGPTIWTLPHGVLAIALMLAGLTAGLISEHVRQDRADKAYTSNQMEHTHNGPAGHEMDVV